MRGKMFGNVPVKHVYRYSDKVVSIKLIVRRGFCIASIDFNVDSDYL